METALCLRAWSCCLVGTQLWLDPLRSRTDIQHAGGNSQPGFMAASSWLADLRSRPEAGVAGPPPGLSEASGVPPHLVGVAPRFSRATPMSALCVRVLDG